MTLPVEEVEYGEIHKQSYGKIFGSDTSQSNPVDYSQKLESIKKTSDDTMALMVLGFKILLFMVFGMILTLILSLAGLIFAYWQFTYVAGENFDNNLFKNQTEIINVAKDLDSLKKCLALGEWGVCLK